jgi:hypothetical protein
MANKRPPLKPQSDLQSQAVAKYNENAMAYGTNTRAFRDALTKVTGGIRGVPTNTTQWGRWSP